MGNFGLAPESVRPLLIQLVKRRKAMGWTVMGFRDNNARMVQSFNRFAEELFDMAAKAKKAVAARPSKREDFQWKGFVDAKLTEQDKASYAAWDIEDDAVWDGIASYCEGGYKIALTYNQANSSFTCSGTGQPDSGANSGYCVTAYAKSPYEAARVWLFKVSAVLPPIWTDYTAADTDGIG